MIAADGSSVSGDGQEHWALRTLSAPESLAARDIAVAAEVALATLERELERGWRPSRQDAQCATGVVRWMDTVMVQEVTSGPDETGTAAATPYALVRALREGINHHGLDLIGSDPPHLWNATLMVSWLLGATAAVAAELDTVPSTESAQLVDAAGPAWDRLRRLLVLAVGDAGTSAPQ